jgi:hypothetical protein
MSDTILNTSWHVEDDKVVVKRSQDVQAILDFNKERNIDGHKKGSDMRLVGSIPFAIVEIWLRESNTKIGSPEFAEYVKKKLMSGDYSKLIANGY